MDPYFSLWFPGWRGSVSLKSFALARDCRLGGRRYLTLIRMCLLPKLPRKTKGVDLEVFPPGSFVAVLMERAVMPAAEWDGELVADFDP